MVLTMTESKFKVGDRVDVIHYGTRRGVQSGIVAKANKRFIELEDGQQFRPDGKDHYPRRDIRFRTNWVKVEPFGGHEATELRLEAQLDSLRAKVTEMVKTATREQLLLAKEALS